MTKPTKKSPLQAYDTDVDDRLLADPFRSSRAGFEALTATLGGIEAASWTHDQLEDHLDTDGRELLRRPYQDHLDLRPARAACRPACARPRADRASYRR